MYKNKTISKKSPFPCKERGFLAFFGRKRERVSGESVAFSAEKCYFYSVKHNCVGADMRVSMKVTGEEKQYE